MTRRLAAYQPLPGDFSGSSASVDMRYFTPTEQRLAKLIGSNTGVYIEAGRATGANVPAWTGASDAETNAMGPGFVAPGSASVVETDSGIDRDYFLYNGNIASAWTGSGLEIAASETADVTWILVIRPTIGATNVFLSQSASVSGERVAAFVTNTGRVQLNNKNTNNPSGSQDIIQTDVGVVVTDERQIIWVSYDHSDKGVAIGVGQSPTPLVTATWTNALDRGGSGLQLGGLAGAQQALGRGYVAIRIDRAYDEIVTEFGAPAFAEILATIGEIWDTL